MPHTNSISSTIKQFLAFTFLTLFITLGLSICAYAQGPVVLTDGQDEYPLGLHLEILEDPTRQLTIEEVVSPEFDRQFVRNQTPELNLGLANSAYWIRFQVSNETRQTNEWWLEIADFEIDNTALYYPRPDGRPGFEMKQGGNAFPAAADQETGHYYPVFRLPLTPRSEQMIFLRVESRRINLPLTLWSGAGFIRDSQKDLMVLGLYLGILFIMAGYNFFLFLVLRDKSYLYYVLFMVGVLLVEILRRYSLQGFLWPNLTWVNKSHIALFVFTLVLIFLFQFAASFLMTKVHTPQLHRIFIGLQIGLGIAVFLSLLWREITLFLMIWLVLVLLTAATIFTTGLVIWWRGYRVARYFVLALALLLGSFFLSILAVLGFLPTSYTEYIGEIGIVLMALLMSLALADRINIIKQEREQAEAETRQRNRELTLLNQVIAATTDAMELETVLETTCRELAQALKMTQAVAVFANEDKSAIRIVADYHPEGQLSILGQSLPVEGNSLFEYLATHNQPLVAEDAQNDPRLASIRHLIHLRGAVSLLVLPLIVEKELVGGFSLSSNKPRRFSADELNLAQSVTEPVARALARIRLVEERQRLEAQYYQAQKMDAIGSLAGGIAHDFNNLLVPIIGYVEMAMVKLTPNNELYPDLEHVYKAAERAAALSRQILAFSRKQVLDIKSVNLNDVVTDFEKMLGRLIGEDIDLQISLAPSLHPVKVDRSQIEQILMNLAVNARDAMPQGGKLIIETDNIFLDEKYAETYAEVIPGPYVMVAVSDSGYGMDDETKRRIFEPFFTTKNQGKGTGLGLSTVHGIVKQHGGHIWVYSEEAIGTTFKIYLPCEEEPASLSSSAKVEAETLSGIETILLVEDDEPVRNLTRQVLQEYGYTLLEAQAGQDALQLATNYTGAIHLLLTDVIMPGISGKAIADRLTEIRPDLKVLFMSGYTDDVIAHHGVLNSGVNFLKKPFNANALAQKVREVLNE